MENRFRYFLLIAILFPFSFACQKGSVTPPSKKFVETPPTRPADEPNSLFFNIQEVSRQKVNGNDEVTWLAIRESKSGTARFGIRILLKQPSGDPPISISEGSFLREDGSQSTEFMQELAKALEAKSIPAGRRKSARRNFTVAILGQGLSRGSGADQIAGGFTSTPPGDWIAMKIFVADGEGEFFLNLNPKTGIGEISMKDSEYGDIVLNELSLVL